MHYGVYTYFRLATKMSAVENCGTRGDENLRFEDSTSDLSVRANETVISDRAIVPPAGTNNRVLHYDAVLPDPNCTSTLPDQARPVHDASPSPDHHISTDGGVRRDPGRWMYLWLLASVRNQHVLFLRGQVLAARSIFAARVPMGQSDPSQPV
jgi:hypothetical protein